MPAALPPHDPGGRVRLRLPPGVTGSATISACGRYRPALARDWTAPGQAPRAVLFVGQNPSVAAAEISDPTCARELGFARDWGFTRYLKGNVLDWRATVPRDLPDDPALACSGQNLPALLAMADEAACIVIATGRLHRRFAALRDRTLAALRASGRPMMCLGRNADGSARHPLYLRRDTAPEPF